MKIRLPLADDGLPKLKVKLGFPTKVWVWHIPEYDLEPPRNYPSNWSKTLLSLCKLMMKDLLERDNDDHASTFISHPFLDRMVGCYWVKLSRFVSFGSFLFWPLTIAEFTIGFCTLVAFIIFLIIIVLLPSTLNLPPLAQRANSRSPMPRWRNDTRYSVILSTSRHAIEW